MYNTVTTRFYTICVKKFTQKVEYITFAYIKLHKKGRIQCNSLVKGVATTLHAKGI